MDTFTVSVSVLLSLIVSLSVVALGAAYVRAGVKRATPDLRAAVGEATQLLLRLQSERARVSGTIAAAARRGVAYSPGPLVEEEASEASAEGGGLPPALLALAQGAGVNVAALMAGDAGEVLKVKALLGKLGGAAAPAPPAADDFL